MTSRTSYGFLACCIANTHHVIVLRPMSHHGVMLTTINKKRSTAEKASGPSYYLEMLTC